MYPELNKLKTVASILVWIVLMLAPAVLKAQAVTEVVTDYGGYWKSGTGAINSVKPDNSHNLVAFSYNGVRYSTGVNDQLLSSKGLSFVPGDFKALPVSSITGTITTNTKIGVGALYDGVYLGSHLFNKPERNLVKYLTDGLNGLDLGTCIANLPVGDIFLPVNNLKANKINDGVPDLLITQIADPSISSLDKYEFTDINGNRIGNSVDIVLNTLPVVGNWTADFYEAYTNPVTLTPGFTQTDRPIRLWAADFSLFGITSAQLNQIAYFKIRLNGNSDVAFVSYNDNTVDMTSPLPATLGAFTAQAAENDVNISWKTITEENTSHFEVEYSIDGLHFNTVNRTNAVGNSTDPRSYAWSHTNVAAGKAYYRLKSVDKNGNAAYSEIIVVMVSAEKSISLSIYPNPASEKIIIKQGSVNTAETYQVRSMSGILVMQKTFTAGSAQNTIDISALSKGSYLLVRVSGSQQEMVKFIKQ